VIECVTNDAGNPYEEDWVIDCDSSEKFMIFYRDKSPCLTFSRTAGHWITSRGRRMTPHECLRIQGISDARVINETPEKIRAMAGNAMCVTVLKNVISAVASSCGLGLLPAAPSGVAATSFGGTDSGSATPLTVRRPSLSAKTKRDLRRIVESTEDDTPGAVCAAGEVLFYGTSYSVARDTSLRVITGKHAVEVCKLLKTGLVQAILPQMGAYDLDLTSGTTIKSRNNKSPASLFGILAQPCLSLPTSLVSVVASSPCEMASSSKAGTSGAGLAPVVSTASGRFGATAKTFAAY